MGEQTVKKHKFKKWRKPGIRMQVMLGFVLFTAVIVTLLWTFQITLLNTFYKAIKVNEVRSVANRVVAMLDESASASDYFEVTRSTNISILISNSDGSNVSFSPAARGGVLERFDYLDCKQLFTEVKAAGGSVMDDNITDPTSTIERQDRTIIYAQTVTLSSGNEYLVLLSCDVIPVDSTVETLKIQLWCLTGVMILLSFGLALFISSRLSKPLEQMNESAKQLGEGKYDIRFPEQGAREVAELAATLNYAAAELSKVEDLRRELIANVSHDLRTPLTMISGYAEVMRDIPGENTPENVQIVIDEANRLTGIVNDLLDLSKLQAGALTLTVSEFNLTEDIRNTLHRYDKLADFSFPFTYDRTVYVCADQLKISQVLYNLVNNAINYSGGNKTVYIDQTVAESTVRVSIRDTGEGIPADKLQYIWDRYYKVDKEHKRAQVGTGLGLSIVKKILDLHGGRYGVASVEGKGSTFWFELPVLRTESLILPEPLKLPEQKADVERGE